ncbi:MAG: type 2 isopentenyl-diphosphate Delta-isomerase [Anaerolineae bacterium]|jgi:isopentenyl-diphosphate delta-isomerase
MLERRKSEHLRINLEEDVSFPRLRTGLERYRFIHNALPEISLEQVDTTTTFLGKPLRLPLLISSITGGTADALRINCHLAEGAQAAGIAMGLGSLRAALEAPHVAETFHVRNLAPDILLFANLGAAQLKTESALEVCQQAVDLTEADALIIHLNPLQEALQSNGNTDWRGILGRIEHVCRHLEVPVTVKEVGWGISADVALQLASAGVSAIDVAGSGGTSWSQVEMHRARTGRLRRLSKQFADWGIPTAESLVEVRAALPEMPLVASGGLRSGMDLAKVLALGANLGGVAGPFLRAANNSAAAVADLAREIGDVLRTVMFCLGVCDIDSLQNTPLLRRISPGDIEQGDPSCP